MISQNPDQKVVSKSCKSRNELIKIWTLSNLYTYLHYNFPTIWSKIQLKFSEPRHFENLHTYSCDELISGRPLTKGSTPDPSPLMPEGGRGGKHQIFNSEIYERIPKDVQVGKKSCKSDLVFPRYCVSKLRLHCDFRQIVVLKWH